MSRPTRPRLVYNGDGAGDVCGRTGSDAGRDDSRDGTYERTNVGTCPRTAACRSLEEWHFLRTWRGMRLNGYTRMRRPRGTTAAQGFLAHLPFPGPFC